MKRSIVQQVVVMVALVFVAYASSAAAQGQWRLELGGYKTHGSALFDGDDDSYFTGSVEYELPVIPHGTLGLRLYPVFFAPGKDPIYGAGGGLSGRVYQTADYQGLYGEIGAAALWHSRSFAHDNSNVDILSEAGVGYRFPNTGVHLALKYQHITDVDLSHPKEGVDSLGLAAGYTF